MTSQVVVSLKREMFSRSALSLCKLAVLLARQVKLTGRCERRNDEYGFTRNGYFKGKVTAV